VRLRLHEKELPFEDRQINFRKSEHLAPEYLTLNPNGVVPTLVSDGIAIIDSSVIIEYLDEVFPQKSMTPTDPAERARMRTWLRYFEEIPTVAVRFPSFNQAFLQHYENLGDDEFSAAAARRPLRRHFYQQMGRTGFSEREVRNSLECMRSTAQRIDGVLADGRPWILGEQLTLADACVAPLFDRIEDLGMPWIWDGLPLLQAYLKRYRSRPSYLATFYEGTRLSSIYGNLRGRAPERDWFESGVGQ
jgi:glutathione S-transferase